MGASRAHFGARRGPARPIREALGLPPIIKCAVINAPASRKRSLRKKSKNMGRFELTKKPHAWMRHEGVFVSYTAITSSPRAYQSTPSTALQLGSWVEQKNAVGKLVIHKYSIKYAFERVPDGGVSSALWGTPRAGAADPRGSRAPAYHQMCRDQRSSL